MVSRTIDLAQQASRTWRFHVRSDADRTWRGEVYRPDQAVTADKVRSRSLCHQPPVVASNRFGIAWESLAGSPGSPMTSGCLPVLVSVRCAGLLPNWEPMTTACPKMRQRSGSDLCPNWRSYPLWPTGSLVTGLLLRLGGFVQDLVAGAWLCGHRRDRAEATGLVVLEGLHQLLPRVHHEGAIGGDGFADGQPAKHQDFELGAAALLTGARGDRHDVTGAVDGELAHTHGVALGADRASTREDVDEGVEVGTPRKSKLRAGGEGGVQQADRGVGDAGTLVARDLAGDHAEQRAAVGGAEQRDRTAPDVLVARRVPLQLGGQVDPELEAVEQPALEHNLLRRRLNVNQTGTRGHPLRIAVGDEAAAAVGVLVPQDAVDHVGDGLEPRGADARGSPSAPLGRNRPRPSGPCARRGPGWPGPRQRRHGGRGSPRPPGRRGRWSPTPLDARPPPGLVLRPVAARRCQR